MRTESDRSGGPSVGVLYAGDALRRLHAWGHGLACFEGGALDGAGIEDGHSLHC